jgi:general nucleoside transport system permease protein
MATTVAAPPAAGGVTRSRPEWLERAVGQGLALLLAVVIALALGSVIIILYGENPIDVYETILRSATTAKDGPAWVLAAATPLIFSALAVSICFKGGLFNIGVEGQYLVAMTTAAWAALHLGGILPGPLLMWGVLLFGMLGGMAYAAVPGALKVKTGAHEVVTTIMMNGIAVSLVAYALNHPLRYTNAPVGQNVDLRTNIFPANAKVPDLGHVFGFGPAPRFSWLFPIAVVAALIVWFIVKRMRLGYEARAVGASAGSAQAGGISIGSVQMKLFLISGALAGLVGMQQILVNNASTSTGGYLPQNYEATLGFTGIAVAFLGQNNPIGIVFAAIFWAALSRGESILPIETNMPREFVIILQGILIMSVVITYTLAKRRLDRRQTGRVIAEEEAIEMQQPEPPPTIQEVTA